MKQTIKQVKVSEIAEIVQQMGIDRSAMINLTIETLEDDLLVVFDRIGQEAHMKGMTEEILEELLAERRVFGNN